MCLVNRLYPCGHCYECLHQKRSDWCIRLRAEYENSLSFVFFGMMTYKQSVLDSISSLDADGNLVYDYVPLIQKAFKRLRKNLPFLEIKYFLSSELGKTRSKRLHHHPVLFISLKDSPKFSNEQQKRRYIEFNQTLSSPKVSIKYQSHKKWLKRDVSASCYWFTKQLEECWRNGFCNLSDLVTEKGLVYCTKYILKSFNRPLRLYKRNGEEFVSDSVSMCSNGLGKSSLPYYKQLFKDVKLLPTSVRLEPTFKLDNSSFLYTSFAREFQLFRRPPFYDVEYYEFSRPLNWTDPQGNFSFPLPRYLKTKLYNDIISRSGLFEDTFKRSQNIKFHLKYVLRIKSICDINNNDYILFFNDDGYIDIFLPDTQTSIYTKEVDRLNDLNTRKQYTNFSK